MELEAYMIVVFISPRQLFITWADADVGFLAESPELVCCVLGRDAGERRRSVANRRAVQLVASASLTA